MNMQDDVSACSNPMPPSSDVHEHADPAIPEQPGMELPLRVARGTAVMNREPHGFRRNEHLFTDPATKKQADSAPRRSVRPTKWFGRMHGNRPWRTNGTPRASLRVREAGSRFTPHMTSEHARALVRRTLDTQLCFGVLHGRDGPFSRPGRRFLFLFHGQSRRDALAIVFHQVSVLPAPQLLSHRSILLVFSFDLFFGAFPSKVSLEVLASHQLGRFDPYGGFIPSMQVFFSDVFPRTYAMLGDSFVQQRSLLAPPRLGFHHHHFGGTKVFLADVAMSVHHPRRREAKTHRTCEGGRLRIPRFLRRRTRHRHVPTRKEPS
mmetsp:Transcript_8112/g.50192  ORF Transcript_8112/g.50192 Transcript_8112/m.50192 type:complete len:320 (-) Transcript_8112:77-1036(-)